MNIQEAIAVFDAAEAELLIVVDSDGERRPMVFLPRRTRCAAMQKNPNSGGAR